MISKVIGWNVDLTVASIQIYEYHIKSVDVLDTMGMNGENFRLKSEKLPHI